MVEPPERGGRDFPRVSILPEGIDGREGSRGLLGTRVMGGDPQGIPDQPTNLPEGPANSPEVSPEELAISPEVSPEELATRPRSRPRNSPLARGLARGTRHSPEVSPEELAIRPRSRPRSQVRPRGKQLPFMEGDARLTGARLRCVLVTEYI